MRRLLGVLVVMAFAVAACTASDPTPGPSTAEPDPALAAFYDQQVEWQPCEDRPGVECATLSVPLDYAQPDGETVAMAVYRMPAAREAAGNVVVLPGGPGASGADYLGDGQDAFRELAASHDVVSYDARAIGATLPIRCDVDGGVGAALVDGDAAVTAWESLAAACEEGADGALGFVGTRELVRDLDVLRAALGEEALALYGMSYGSLVGSEYARAFPAYVARLVLDSPLPASAWADDDPELLAARGEETLDAALAECFANPFLECPLGSTPAAVRERLEALLAELEAEPVDLAGRGTLTREGALAAITSVLSSGPTAWWPLVVALGRASAGQWDELAAMASQVEAAEGTSWAVIMCADLGPATRSVEDVRSLATDLGERYPLFGEGIAWSALRCSGLPVGPTLEVSTEPVAVGGEVLIVSSDGDPIIPPEYVAAMTQQMTGAHTLRYAGPEHVAYLWSDCVRVVVNTFLADGSLPDFDVCAAR